MDIKRLFYGFLRRSWIVLILAVIGGGLAAYIAITTSVPTYEASSTLYLMNRDKVQAGESLDSGDINLSRQLAQDYSQIIQSHEITSAVLSKLNQPYLNDEMLNSIISVNLQKDSSMLSINVTWPDASMAALITNTTAAVFVDKMKELTHSDNIVILDKATVPQYPLPEGKSKKILVGILAGLALGFGIIYVLELFDTRIRSAEDIKNELNLNVIGIIPEHDIR